MKFPYFKLPNADPSAKFISVPWIPVTIKANDKEQTFLMLVDSGADNCIFDKDVAEFLEIDSHGHSPWSSDAHFARSILVLHPRLEAVVLACSQ